MTRMPLSGRIGEPSCNGALLGSESIAIESGRYNDDVPLIVLTRLSGDDGSPYPSPPLSSTEVSFRPETR